MFVSRRACGASEDDLTSNLKPILIFDRFYVLFSMKTRLLIFDENPTGLCVQDCLLTPLLGRYNWRSIRNSPDVAAGWFLFEIVLECDAEDDDDDDDDDDDATAKDCWV